MLCRKFSPFLWRLLLILNYGHVHSFYRHTNFTSVMHEYSMYACTHSRCTLTIDALLYHFRAHHTLSSEHQHGVHSILRNVYVCCNSECSRRLCTVVYAHNSIWLDWQHFWQTLWSAIREHESFLFGALNEIMRTHKCCTVHSAYTVHTLNTLNTLHQLHIAINPPSHNWTNGCFDFRV